MNANRKKLKTLNIFSKQYSEEAIFFKLIINASMRIGSEGVPEFDPSVRQDVVDLRIKQTYHILITVSETRLHCHRQFPKIW